jgi:hypothetical protein
MSHYDLRDQELARGERERMISKLRFSTVIPVEIAENVENTLESSGELRNSTRC